MESGENIKQKKSERYNKVFSVIERICDKVQWLGKRERYGKYKRSSSQV